MSENDFCGTKLRSKVATLDSASLLREKGAPDEGGTETSQTKEESLGDTYEKAMDFDVVSLQSLPAAGTSQNAKKRHSRRKERKAKRADPFEDLKADEAAIARIKERFLRPHYSKEALRKKKRGRTIKEPMVILHNNNPASAKIHNTAAYDKSIAAIKGLNARFFMKPSFLAELIPAPDICALCQEPAGYENLGFLCGPYYMTVSTSKHWPPFLRKKPKPHDESLVYEAGLKFHVRCIATAPELERVDKFIVGVEEYMPKYWKQNCQLCKCVGATVHCSNGQCHKIYHLPCALSSGNYDYSQCSFTCRQCI